MRKTALLGAAALLAAIIPAGAASAQSGHVGVNYNNGSLDSGPSIDFDGWSADGVAAFDMGGSWGSQVGVTYSDNSINGGGNLKDWGIDGHLYHRDSSWQWGGALAYNSIDAGSGSNINTWTAAAEARWFMTSSSLGASLGYSDVDAGSGSNAHAWRLAGDGRFFISENFDLNAGLGYEDLSGSGNAHAWGGSIGAEYQFSSMPISIYGGYGRNQLSQSGSDLNTDVWTLGARWNFGGGTLQERDKTGANLSHTGGPFERIFFGN